MGCLGCCNCCGCGTADMTELPVFTTGVTSDILWDFDELYADRDLSAVDPYPCPDGTYSHLCARRYQWTGFAYYGDAYYTPWQVGMTEECNATVCSGSRTVCCRRAILYRVKSVINSMNLRVFRCKAPNPTCSTDSADANACRYLVTGTMNVTATVQRVYWNLCADTSGCTVDNTDCTTLPDFPTDYDTGYPGFWSGPFDGAVTSLDITRSRMYDSLKVSGSVYFNLSTSKIQEQCCIDWPTADASCKTSLKCTADPDAIITVVPACWFCLSCTTTTLNFNIDGGDWTFTLI
jgi:hypothetical protein